MSTVIQLPKLRRHTHWPTKLNDYIHSARDVPFAWGKHDCALFVANCILAMTGIDVAHGWRNEYQSEEDLAGLLARRNINSFPELMDSLAIEYDMPKIPVKFTRRGDAIIYETTMGPTMGIVTDFRVVGVGLEGLKFTRMDSIYRDPTAKAWGV